MIISFSCGAPPKQLISAGESFRRQMVCQMSVLPGSQLHSVFHFRSSHFQQGYTVATLSKSFGSQAHHDRALSCSLFKQKEENERISRVRWNFRPRAWLFGGTSAGLFVSFASTKAVSVEADSDESREDGSAITSSHGKKVFTNYSITGIPGDGRCLFRSVAHGACLRSGKPVPSESLQRELADDLRARVADEFVKRRAETEWFLEDDFDTYVSQIRKPQVWGGEPELLMASHVLQMPITVYMHDASADGLIIIAEYGQEYGKENPIRILYHGFGHYDALQILANGGQKSRL